MLSVSVCALVLSTLVLSDPGAEPAYRVSLTVTSDLPCPKVPMDPTVDFGRIIREGRLPGVVDPNSIDIINKATGQTVPFARSEDFAYGDRGRLEWVIENPRHTAFEIRFRTAAKRPALESQKHTPLVGVGDLVRYNAGVPRPVTLAYPARLVDLTGDGKADLVGTWNYAYRPGWPWDGIVCYPRVGSTDCFEFGDLVRIRHKDSLDAADFKHFECVYMTTGVADLNGDNLPDVVYCPSRSDRLYFYLNSGRRDEGGMPVFVATGSVPRQTTQWQPCRAVDLDGDGTVDFVVGSTYLRNTAAKRWPIELAPAVTIDAGRDPCFADLDGDGKLDAVGLAEGPPGEPELWKVTWRKGLGGDPPRFAPPETLGEIDDFWVRSVAAVEDGSRRGLLVQSDVWQQLVFYEQRPHAGSKPSFQRCGPAESLSAVLALSDQAWPCLCDWDGDGDLDLLVGGGYGWPRILINQGSNARPAFAEPQLILSEGKPIRILMSLVYPGCERYKHNMGYPYPVYVDWDGDGLSDLLLPNCSNRIFWYQNVGTRREPRFGPRLQLNPEGYEDTPEKRAATGCILMTRWEGELEEGQPFFWRTGAAFADWNGDGLTDLITHDGATREATLFVQYRDAAGQLRLKKDHALVLPDGRPLDDSVVGRQEHWTESFRAADWDSDGLLDLIYSCAGSSHRASIYLLRNIGTKAAPMFDLPQALCCYGEPIKVTAHGPHPWVGDLDGDGRSDILTCVEWSVYPFYSHAAVQMQARPEFRLGPLELP